jgi:hypothetical protein
LNADIEPQKKDRLGLPLPEAIPKLTLIRVIAFGPAFQNDINPRATRDLQYIGLFGNDSHSQIFVKILQKSSHLGLYSKELNFKAENEVHKNFNAHLRYLYKQAYKNIAIGDGTILVNKKSQLVGVNLINDFIALTINIEVHILFGTSSGN